MFLRTPFGVPSLLPCALTIASSWLNIIPVPNFVRPLLFIPVLLAAVHALLIAAARLGVDDSIAGVVREAKMSFWLGLCLIVIYPAGLAVIDDHLPRTLGVLKVVVWGWSMLLPTGVWLSTIGIVVIGSVAL